jgi:hypothetical protein
MTRAATLLALLAAAAASSGCTYAPSIHAPAYAAPGELVLTYDDGYVVSAGGQPVARGPRYDGLTSFVGCVPAAAAHAQAAQSDGSAAGPLQVGGAIVAAAGLGGLGGLYYIDKNPTAAAAILAGGFGVQLVGLILVGIGAQLKVNAHGHAVDSLNYYNDAAGSQGAACTRRSW